jgi:phage shock protein A
MGVRRGVFRSVAAGVAYVLTTVYQLPKQIRRFLGRLDVVEKRAMELKLRIDTLEREIRALKAAAPAASSQAPISGVSERGD